MRQLERQSNLRLLLALASGLLLALLCPRFDLWWLAPLAVTPLALAIATEYVPWKRFLLGWLSGMVFWAITCSWIASVLDVHGAMGTAAGWGAFALFCVLKSLHYGLFGMLGGVLVRHWYGVPAAALLWAGLERTQQPLTGFGWYMLGNAGIEMPFVLRLAPITGVYGLSFVFALTGIAIALMILRRLRTYTVWALVAVVPLFLPALPEDARVDNEAVAVQPNFPVLIDWSEETYKGQKALLRHLTLSATAAPRPAMVLWPETPTPIFYHSDPDLQATMRDIVTRFGAPAILGTLATTASDQPLNSAQLVGPDGRPSGRYDKMFLVPFGEFVPDLFSWVNQVSSEVGEYTAGEEAATFGIDGHSAGVFICYESAVPHHVREFAARGANVFVNLSNDAYFFRSAAREQHLNLVRMRAVENGRWALRVTNNGITASIDPAGAIREVFPQFEGMSGRLPFGWLTHTTIYTDYGDWFAWSALAIALGCLVVTQWPDYDSARDRLRRGKAGS